MRKRLLLFTFTLLMCFLCVKSYGQVNENDETRKIHWRYYDGVDDAVFADTLQIIKHIKGNTVIDYKYNTKHLWINNKHFFLLYCNVGFGVSNFDIAIYKQTNGKWKYIARGMAHMFYNIIPVADSQNNRILFYTREYDMHGFYKDKTIGDLPVNTL